MNTLQNLKTFKAEDFLNIAEDVRLYLESCLGRESLYKSFGSGKHPRFETVFKVVQALGLRFNLKPSL